MPRKLAHCDFFNGAEEHLTSAISHVRYLSRRRESTSRVPKSPRDYFIFFFFSTKEGQGVIFFESSLARFATFRRLALFLGTPISKPKSMSRNNVSNSSIVRSFFFYFSI